MVERWSGGAAEWRSGGVAEWRSGSRCLVGGGMGQWNSSLKWLGRNGRNGPVLRRFFYVAYLHLKRAELFLGWNVLKSADEGVGGRLIALSRRLHEPSGVEGGAVGRWGRVVRWGEVARCGVGTLITRRDATRRDATQRAVTACVVCKHGARSTEHGARSKPLLTGSAGARSGCRCCRMPHCRRSRASPGSPSAAWRARAWECRQACRTSWP